MRFALSLAVLAVGLMAGSAEAETYHLIGQGTLSCGTWVSVRRYGQDLGYGQWVLGFLSGVGFMGNGFDPLNRLDADGGVTRRFVQNRTLSGQGLEHRSNFA